MVVAAAMPFLIWLGGCDSVPGANVGTPSLVKVLDVLDPDFVRFEGERMPVDEFLFRMRQLGRRAAKTKEPLFGIRIVVHMDTVDQKLLSRIFDGLRLSGIRHVELG